MSLAIFDLDNTLIAGDSDHAWGEFLVERGIVEAESFRKANDRFFREYQEGGLDIHAYLNFALEPLTRFTLTELDRLHRDFMEKKIKPLFLRKAADLIDHHRQRGDHLLIITATNSFITGPIAEWLGVEHLLACDAEIADGRYTGRPLGIPCFQEGKVERLHQWSADTGETLHGSYFYSDSANDIPLLSEVSHPVAVDPCPRLRDHARQMGWPIISLRD